MLKKDCAEGSFWTIKWERFQAIRRSYAVLFQLERPWPYTWVWEMAAWAATYLSRPGAWTKLHKRWSLVAWWPEASLVKLHHRAVISSLGGSYPSFSIEPISYFLDQDLFNFNNFSSLVMITASSSGWHCHVMSGRNIRSIASCSILWTTWKLWMIQLSAQFSLRRIGSQQWEVRKLFSRWSSPLTRCANFLQLSDRTLENGATSRDSVIGTQRWGNDEGQLWHITDMWRNVAGSWQATHTPLPVGKTVVQLGHPKMGRGSRDTVSSGGGPAVKEWVAPLPS